MIKFEKPITFDRLFFVTLMLKFYIPITTRYCIGIALNLVRTMDKDACI